MSTIETKRRGRPPKTKPPEDAVVEPVEADAVDDEVQVAEPSGPPCPRCGRPTLRSTSLLSRYEMAAIWCVPCREVSIEGDEPNMRYDVETARNGSPPVIFSRAMTIYEQRHYVKAPPPAERDPGYEAMNSDWDDDRWQHFDL